MSATGAVYEPPDLAMARTVPLSVNVCGDADKATPGPYWPGLELMKPSPNATCSYAFLHRPGPVGQSFGSGERQAGPSD
jgi:hypothetical protein